MIGAIVLFIISATLLVMSILSFMKKGFLFNNAYIYASKEEREKMDKAPHYRQSGIVFLLLSLIFLLNGFDMLFKTDWLFYLVIAVLVATFIYAIVSSVVIEKRGK